MFPNGRVAGGRPAGGGGYEIDLSFNFDARFDDGAASLVLMLGTPGVRAEIVTAQGADNANGVGDDPYAVPEEGELVTATAGSIQPVTDPSNSAFATGGNGGSGGNVPGNGTGAPGGAATATAATTVNSGSAEADATAIGGNGGNIGGNNQNDGYGGGGIFRRKNLRAFLIPRPIPPVTLPIAASRTPLGPPSRGRERAGDREGGPPWGGDYHRHCAPRRRRIEVSEGATVRRW